MLIFESHPIQYRAPVYQRLAQLIPGAIHVAYASDFSVKGGLDPGFGQSFSWDLDLLSDYPYTVLQASHRAPPWRWHELRGGQVPSLIDRLRPKVVLLNSLSYQFDWAAYMYSRWRRIPVWMRCETQDHAFRRSRRKSLIRSMAYRTAYSGIRMSFAIGELNRQHWLCHGIPEARIRFARYCTPDRVRPLSEGDLHQRRSAIRERLGLRPNQLLVSFFGKLIPKKDPALLIHAAAALPAEIQARLALLFVGSGDLQAELERQSHELQHASKVPSYFAGFVNQRELVNWYLAADIVVLPSIQAGETWGLVVNEALQAGCGVVVSEAVGCSADFGGWQRVRTIPVGSALHLAKAIEDLAPFQRDFNWAVPGLQAYSIEAAAQAFAAALQELP
jgi:glycosyltransferase involved in cell wall biosynthesis